MYNSALRQITHKTDLCVVGGGLAGLCAALAAARNGIRVILMQDRPVLGGNASSEIRMWVRGAKGKCNRETGILSEMEEENIYRNPTLEAPLWDSVMFGTAMREKNLTLLMNCSVVDARTEDGRILSVTGWQLTTYTWHKVEAKYFADCSGDSILAPLVGARYRIGREAEREFGESIGHAEADRKTMGMSCLLQARETEGPVKFTPPDWANVYETDDAFIAAVSPLTGKAMIRDHKVGTSGGNLWWMELGGEDDSIHDTERLRDELLKVAFGVWDHIKNRGDHGYENWKLEWVGFLPGKRESRRYEGGLMLTQNHIAEGGKFDDVVAFGGWPMDDHNPCGIRMTAAKEEPSILYEAPSPYGIPYRVLYSADVANLFMAGRNISATHAALSSTRVMATCSLLGQAVGTAAAIACQRGADPAMIYPTYIPELQARLMEDNCFLPGLRREMPALTRRAKINLPADTLALLQDGIERPREDADHAAELPLGGEITFSFDVPETVSELRLVFDPDFSRETISPNRKMQVFAQRLHTGMDFVPVKVAATLVRRFTVLADGVEVAAVGENYHSLVKLPLNVTAKALTVRFEETWGAESVRLYACDAK